MHLSGILALEIGDLFFNFEGVAAENLGELLDSSLALRAVPVAPGVPIPEDTPLLILAEQLEGLVARPLHADARPARCAYVFPKCPVTVHVRYKCSCVLGARKHARDERRGDLSRARVVNGPLSTVR